MATSRERMLARRASLQGGAGEGDDVDLSKLVIPTEVSGNDAPRRLGRRGSVDAVRAQRSRATTVFLPPAEEVVPGNFFKLHQYWPVPIELDTSIDEQHYRHIAEERTKVDLIGDGHPLSRLRQVMHRPSEGSNPEVGNVHLPMRTKFVPAGIKQMGSDAYDMNAFEIITEFPQIGPWKTFHVREKVFRQELVLRCILKNQATPQEMHRARRQVYLQSRINHPQIEHLFMAWEDKTCLYLALEFGGGNTVASMMENRGGTLPEAEIIRALIVPLLKILTLMHHCGLVHGDLRPEIVTFDRGSKAFTLCGFIHVANVHVECLEKSSGRAAYLAPEALEGKGKDAKVGPGRLGITQALDIWALGVMLVQVATGEYPFPTAVKGEPDPLKTYRYQLPNTFSAEFRNFVHKILVVKPSERPTARQLMEDPLVANECAEFLKAFKVAAEEKVDMTLEQANYAFTDSLATVTGSYGDTRVKAVQTALRLIQFTMKEGESILGSHFERKKPLDVQLKRMIHDFDPLVSALASGQEAKGWKLIRAMREEGDLVGAGSGESKSKRALMALIKQVTIK